MRGLQVNQHLTPCSQCRRLLASFKEWDQTVTLTCEAFPDGVPRPIANGSVLHADPQPGDGGLTCLGLETDGTEGSDYVYNLDAEPHNAHWLSILRKQKDREENE